jgi:hypothetical protein
MGLIENTGKTIYALELTSDPPAIRQYRTDDSLQVFFRCLGLTNHDMHARNLLNNPHIVNGYQWVIKPKNTVLVSADLNSLIREYGRICYRIGLENAAKAVEKLQDEFCAKPYTPSFD